MYAALTLLVPLALWWTTQAAGRGGLWRWAVLYAVTSLALYTHILAALIMAAVLTPVIGRSLIPSIIALISFGWMGYARIIRGDILSVKERDYVLAARVVGVKDSRILWED